jgi:antitoxin (DNA-binding transcriptional repressor) of toxin-antitoxin stability system
MIRLNISEAQANLSRYLERVEKGEVITLCRRNVPIAEIRRLVHPPREPRPVGIDRGMVVPEAFHDPLPEDILASFCGDHEAPDECA